MASIALGGSVGRAVAEYTGKPVIALEAIPDPQTPAFAVRAVITGPIDHEYSESSELFFLVRVPLQTVTADDLEEVEFTSWPPRMRS